MQYIIQMIYYLLLYITIYHLEWLWQFLEWGFVKGQVWLRFMRNGAKIANAMTDAWECDRALPYRSKRERERERE